jgi:hypothetical protein
MAFTLAQQIVRTINIFQGLLAFVVLCATGGRAIDILAYPEPRIYSFMSVSLVLVSHL